jgi:osmotically-inducible protein OsmY
VHVTDDDLGRSVSDELSSDPSITVDADIRVSVIDGEVTLRGTVVRYSDKRGAMDAARRVRGVKSVKDQIDVVGRTDPELRSDVVEELRIGHIPATVNAEVHEGIVTLTGAVEHQHHRDAAAFIAKVVPNVVGVEDLVEVTGRSQESEDVEDSMPAQVSQIAESDAESMAADGDEPRRQLGARLAAAARRIEQLRSASEAGGNVVEFKLERYLEALESDAIDAHSRLAALSGLKSYEGKVLQREIIALESGVAVAELKLDAARAAERDDHRGEVEAQVRAMHEETRRIRTLFERTFGMQGRTSDPVPPGDRPDLR